MNLSKYIDHTILKATATPSDIKQLCKEAKEYNFYAVCVNGCYVELAKEEVEGSEVKVAAVIGFPLGAMSIGSKITEALSCVDEGADEIDMVINIGMLKSGNLEYVGDEIFALRNICKNKILKVIIETCYLSEEEKRTACQLAMNAGADFVKTSTGFGAGGATLEDVKLMKEVVGDKLKIKASGGIKDKETAKEYIALGISRIGTSSGIKIVS
ncbi:MAG: deoxyribose-phosphate aldolase [Flavobacteriaceae bacterium]|nr:deoxyribose-phosphate aldolase [Flavobacteriaceae bacterium]